MRIVAGRFRGRRLDLPAGSTARPTSDRAREALFSILSGVTEGARVLDLFAGSGALGIEALSRGAASVVFVESDRLAAQSLATAAVRMGLAAAEFSIVTGDAFEALSSLDRRGTKFDLVLADPPWSAGLTVRVAAAVPALLSGAGVAVVELDAKSDPPEGDWEVRKYGSVAFAIHPPRRHSRR